MIPGSLPRTPGGAIDGKDHIFPFGDIFLHKLAAGLSFDLGGIKVSDYQTIKITFVKNFVATNGSNLACIPYLNGGTTEFSGDNYVHYSDIAAFVLDLKAGAEANNVSIINTFELAVTSWANVTDCTIYIASIELVLADTTAE